MAANPTLNRAQMTVSGTPGTGTVTLGSAVSNYLSFATAGAVNATAYTYLIIEGTSWELGTGTYTSSGTTFSRDTVDLTSAGNTTKISFTSAAIIGIVESARDFADFLQKSGGTVTGLINFTGTNANFSSAFANAKEVTTIAATAATGTINYDIGTQGIWIFTANATANWTENLRFSSVTSLNSAMAINETVTVTHIVKQGTTAYYNNVVQVDGTTTGVTTTWQGGAPTGGNASGEDVYTYAITKTASATFSVRAALTQFK